MKKLLDLNPPIYGILKKNLIPYDLISKDIPEPTFELNLPDSEYHSVSNYLGSSSIKEILNSPIDFYYNHFESEKKQTESMKLGSLIHTVVLEGHSFLDRYIIAPDFGSLKKKSNKLAREKFYKDLDDNKIIITEEEFKMIERILHNFTKDNYGFQFLMNGKTEVSGFYVDKITHLKLKIRCDFLSNDFKTLIDIKSSRSVELSTFNDQFFRLGYYIQLAHYADGVRAITGVYPETIKIICIQSQHPYKIKCYDIPFEIMMEADANYREALNKIKKCIVNSDWRVNQTQEESLYFPGWFKNKRMIEEGQSYESINF